MEQLPGMTIGKRIEEIAKARNMPAKQVYVEADIPRMTYFHMIDRETPPLAHHLFILANVLRVDPILFGVVARNLKKTSAGEILLPRRRLS